jgi:penicillin-binding protein 3
VVGLFNKTPIHFHGQREIKLEKRKNLEQLMQKRLKIMIIVIIVIGLIFSLKLFSTQIRQKDYYDAKLTQYNTNTFQVDAQRGEIMDRNYKPLVQNKTVICATYYAVKGIKDEEIDAMTKFLMKNVNVDISEVTTRQKKDFLIMKDEKYVTSLIPKKELNAIKGSDSEKSDLTRLQLHYITDDILKKKLSDDDIKYYKIFYAIKSCTSGSSVVLSDISVKEASIIGEHSDLLRGIQVTSDWERKTTDKILKRTLGNLTTRKQGLPSTKKDELIALDYTNDARVGTSGIEGQYEDILKGVSSTYSISYDSNGTPTVKLSQEGTNGANIQLTIDWDLQKKISDFIDKELLAHRSEPFNDHIYCILEDPTTGDIIAMVGREIDQKTGKITDYSAGNYLSAYRIGSTMKSAVIYTAFKNKVIKANHYEDDTPQGLKIAGTKTKYSWKKGLGHLNEVSALAYSSNIWMMQVIIKLAGGKYQYNKPLKINKDAFTKLRNGAGELGLGVKTGIDVDNEALGYRGNAQNAGNLLDFSIGQYDTYTNMQLATYATTLANMGVKITPHLYKSSFTYDDDGNIVTLDTYQKKIVDDMSDQKTALKQIRAGMKAVIDYGTVSGQFKGFPYQVAAKTGTAEDYTHSGNTDYPNHLLIGYSSVDNPQIVCTVMVERQKNNNSAPSVWKYAVSQYFEKYGYKK